MLLGGENRLLGDLNDLKEAAAVPGAKRHALGLIRRHQMLQRCRMWLRERCLEESGAGPLSPHALTDLNIHVNAYYVALCGALDNLAWTLTYELSLKEPIDELDKSTQRFVGAGGTAFLAALAQSAGSIALRLYSAKAWFSELRAFRDPAAHRLPLSVVSGVMTEADVAEHTRIGEESAKAFEAGDYDAGMELFHRQANLGKFEPWLEHPNGPVAEPSFFMLPNLLARDQAFFVDTVGTVVLIMLRRLGASPMLPPWSASGNPRSSWEIGAYLKPFEPYRSPFKKRS